MENNSQSCKEIANVKQHEEGTKEAKFLYVLIRMKVRNLVTVNKWP